MAKGQIHITDNGPAACQADASKPGARGCPFEGSGHFDTWEEAGKAFDEAMGGAFGRSGHRSPRALAIEAGAMDFYEEDLTAEELEYLSYSKKPAILGGVAFSAATAPKVMRRLAATKSSSLASIVARSRKLDEASMLKLSLLNSDAVDDGLAMDPNATDRVLRAIAERSDSDYVLGLIAEHKNSSEATVSLAENKQAQLEC